MNQATHFVITISLFVVCVQLGLLGVWLLWLAVQEVRYRDTALRKKTTWMPLSTKWLMIGGLVISGFVSFGLSAFTGLQWLGFVAWLLWNT